MLPSRTTRAQPMHTLISADNLQVRVRSLAEEIHRDHPYGVHLVCVLKGAFVFLADLARALPGDCSLDFIAVASYGHDTSAPGDLQARQRTRGRHRRPRRRHRRGHRRYWADAGLSAACAQSATSPAICGPRACSTSRRVVRSGCQSSTLASRSKTSSSSGTVSTTESGTETSPSSRSSANRWRRADRISTRPLQLR